MTHVRCKFVRLREEARAPTKAYPSDAGFDLYSPDSFTLLPGESRLVKTGIAIELPSGFGAVVRSRSSQAKRGVVICGGTGTVDPGYRGDIGVGLHNLGTQTYMVERGHRIAQLVIERVYDVELVECDELSPSDRQTSGFGSSGR